MNYMKVKVLEVCKDLNIKQVKICMFEGVTCISINIVYMFTTKRLQMYILHMTTFRCKAIVQDNVHKVVFPP